MPLVHESNDLSAIFSPMMAMHRDFRWSLTNFVLVTLLVASSAAREICDKSKCSGPLTYYKGLNCKPVYKNTNDCCPESFDCSHLKNLSEKKCYANGNEYSIGESLKDEDANACDIGCTCVEGYNGGLPYFSCAIVDCPFSEIDVRENCFHKNTPDTCCATSLVCLKEGEKRATCEVDGKTYKEGEYFQPKSDSGLNCYCMPNYKGENVAPFCKKHHCRPLFRGADDVRQNCVPVFYVGQNPQTDCNIASRCQNENDTVISNHDAKAVVETDESKMCRFGNLTMYIGDELNQDTGYDSRCVKCVCEVPPFPTCMHRDDGECAPPSLPGTNLD
ncbi:uncharacterized protein LOC116431101 [Nomia melanderi]|uniref:uncharacterized protein LOC116431101 n=1 Tax=Nomia melanderi TaxID=2448451 RepID=UPI0013042B56|nr:uncharacterized protein LOC116431101 [Nomia melanderi]